MVVPMLPVSPGRNRLTADKARLATYHSFWPLELLLKPVPVTVSARWHINTLAGSVSDGAHRVSLDS
jgi:hypothetical protein